MVLNNFIGRNRTRRLDHITGYVAGCHVQQHYQHVVVGTAAGGHHTAHSRSHLRHTPQMLRRDAKFTKLLFRQKRLRHSVSTNPFTTFLVFGYNYSMSMDNGGSE